MIAKKICFVVTSPFTVNAFLVNHISELSKFFRVTLCTNLSIYPLSQEIINLNITIINVPLERRIHIYKDLISLWCLFKFFYESQFVSVHSITPKSGLLSMIAAFFAGIPNRFHTFTGQIWVRHSGLSRFIFKRIDWLIGKFATHLFADSKSQIDFLLREKVCKPNQIELIGTGSISGVDLNRFLPNEILKIKVRFELLTEPNDFVFIFVGRLNKDKGLFDLFEAFSKMNVSHINPVLWIVGPDEEGITEMIKSIFPEQHKHAKWIGPTFTPELYMLAADVLLLPSYREGFGSVIIEAAACGLPTIAYRTDGVVDAVVDGQTGFLINLGDVEGMKVKMQSLVEDAQLKSCMGYSARLRACNEFSSEFISQEWINFYKKLSN